MKVLLWHVHGSWTTALVNGRHDYVLPVTPGRDEDGRGLARTWRWPQAREVRPDRLKHEQPDVVILQRPHELDLLQRWTGMRAGVDVPAVYVEHNTPKANAPWQRHPMASHHDIPLVHVTPFNAMFWDNGRAHVHVIEHGIPDPGHRWDGELPRAAVCINEPTRRRRVTGTDLLPQVCASVPVDMFGTQVSGLARSLGISEQQMSEHNDLPQVTLHTELARRRVYVHTARWTSLGLTLLEAMHLGMPVVALATTDAINAVPVDAGVLTTSVDELCEATAWLVHDASEASRIGKVGRAAALSRYSLSRFLSDWDAMLEAVSW